MPGKSGFDVLRWLQASGKKDLPVVMLTGSNLERDKEESFALGAYQVLPDGGDRGDD